MKKKSAIATLRDAPERKLVYRDAGNGILFIGTHHDSLGIIPKAEIDRMKCAVEKQERLFFEGSRSQFSQKEAWEQEIARDMVEWVAYDHHKGESVFLDDLNTVNRFDLAKMRGLRPYLYAGLFAYEGVLSIVKRGIGSCGEVCTITANFLERIRRYNPELFPHNDGRRSAAAATEAALRSENLFGNLLPAHELADTFVEFMARIRDAEIYGPLLRDVASQASGNKGVVIGSKHIENLICVLEGQTLEMPDWDSYVGRMSDDARKSLKQLSDAIDRVSSIV
jgi:hypothetical protein